MIRSGNFPRPPLRQRRKKTSLSCAKLLILSVMAIIVLLYLGVMITLTLKHTSTATATQDPPQIASLPKTASDVDSSASGSKHEKEEADQSTSQDKDSFFLARRRKNRPKIESPKKVLRPGFKPEAYGAGVDPHILIPHQDDNDNSHKQDDMLPAIPRDQVLTAYMEPVYQDEWDIKPLPIRESARADKLKVVAYPQLNSCQHMMEQYPSDEYDDSDPFLPWIHDVFPTDDGRFIQFVAQNRRRCNTGAGDTDLLEHLQPQVSLFQHVPVKRIDDGRYRLSTHEDADPDGVATRFICRFKPSMEETLSVYNFDYEWAAHRKHQKKMFTEEGRRDIKSVHTSQLIFQCPVPESLVETVQSGASVVDDWATLFVDLIPIRTPPRFGNPTSFLKPRYKDVVLDNPKEIFNATEEWGTQHILPPIPESGRWENIPICKPSLLAYEPEMVHASPQIPQTEEGPPKKHNLVACMWASTGYTTRGNRFAVNDGQRRMLEWISFNKLVGFDHFYLYDNSGAFNEHTSLKPIADLFPGEITYMKWPAKVCNNRPNNVDSPGERSSQYAAESSCRLRFGPHVNWIGQFDLDEYLVPVGNYTSLLPLLDKLDHENKKIISFGSWRAWPRRNKIEKPEPIEDRKQCWSPGRCFDVRVPMNVTMLQAYNCDRQKGPKKEVMPAEKQVYRPSFVKQHFIHYSSVTAASELNPQERAAAGMKWEPAFPDPHSRFADETNEATMLHTKAIARQDTAGWDTICRTDYQGYGTCRIGNPYPEGADEETEKGDAEGWAYNCYVNEKVDNYWVPLLSKAVDEKLALLG